MKVDILLKIADTVLAVDKAAWAMGQWWKPNCQTVGCAIGHAINKGVVPGLKIEMVSPWGYAARLMPTFELTKSIRLCGFEAVAHVLDIPEHHAQFLFDPQEYDSRDDEGDPIATTREHVASRIQEYVRSGGGNANEKFEWS